MYFPWVRSMFLLCCHLAWWQRLGKWPRLWGISLPLDIECFFYSCTLCVWFSLVCLEFFYFWRISFAVHLACSCSWVWWCFCWGFGVGGCSGLKQFCIKRKKFFLTLVATSILKGLLYHVMLRFLFLGFPLVVCASLYSSLYWCPH